MMNTALVRFTPDLAVLFAIGVMAAGVVGAERTTQILAVALVSARRRRAGRGADRLEGLGLDDRRLLLGRPGLGPAIGCLLAAVVTDRPRPLVRLLDTRPLRSLGSFSYSLYLTHAPIVIAVSYGIVAGRVPPACRRFSSWRRSSSRCGHVRSAFRGRIRDTVPATSRLACAAYGRGRLMEPKACVRTATGSSGTAHRGCRRRCAREGRIDHHRSSSADRRAMSSSNDAYMRQPAPMLACAMASAFGVDPGQSAAHSASDGFRRWCRHPPHGTNRS